MPRPPRAGHLGTGWLTGDLAHAGVTRTTRWEHYETGGVIDWPALLRSFGAHEEYLRAGLAVHDGQLTSPPVGQALGLPAIRPEDALA